MIQRCHVLIASALFTATLPFVLAGCSDSPPTPPAAASSPVATSAVPSKPLTAQEKKAQQREFDNMGVKEKREWRRQQREAAGGSAPTPGS